MEAVKLELVRKHYTRLRWYFSMPRGSAAMCDNIDLDLSAAGYIDRQQSRMGAVTFSITPLGQQALAEEKQREIARRKPHQLMGERLAEWLRNQGRITWENVEFLVDLEEGVRQAVRPDVYSLLATTNPDRLEPVVHEIKVSRADFLADVAKPDKRAGYARLGEKVYYVTAENLVAPEEVPDGCGLVYEISEGEFKIAKKAKKKAVMLTGRQFMNMILKPGACNPPSW